MDDCPLTLKERWEAFKASRGQKQPLQITPPVYDEVYYAAMRRCDEEDGYAN